MNRILPFVFLAFAACGPKVAPAPAAASATDPRVVAFASEVVDLAERHSWNAIVERADEAHRATQIGDMGMTTEQYVAEVFGLHTVGNSIDAADDGVDAADLARLGHFAVTDVVDVPDDDRGARTDVHGTVQVNGARPLHFTLEVVVRPDGQLRLTGAVG